MMPSYQTPNITLTRGEGVHVWDVEGNRYVDFIAGLAVNALGHAHPAAVKAISDQAARLGHVSNLYANEVSIELAERLLDLFGNASASGKVFFCNSGAEANEAAFKIARRTGRPNIVAMSSAFHGRTMGSLALTGQPAKQEPFFPMTEHVIHVPYGDVDALRNAVDENTAAVFVEPILGEAGVVVPPAGYLRSVRDITTEAGALMVCDEVQTGIGRTGAWFAHQWEQIEPDVVTLAKGLGGGLPLGACIAFGKASSLLQPGMHGSTFGGNPIAAAAAIAVLNVVHSDNLVARASVTGRRLLLGVNDLAHPAIAGVRGRGLLIGIGLQRPIAGPAVAAAARAGYLINAASTDVLRLAPPLIVTEGEVDGFLAVLPGILDAADAH